MPRSAEPRAEHRFLINSISCSSRESLLLQQRTVTVTQESSPVTLPFDSYAGVSSTPGRSSISNQQHQLQQSRVLTTTTEDAMPGSAQPRAEHRSLINSISCSSRESLLLQQRTVTVTPESIPVTLPFDSYAAVSSTPGRSSISNQQHQLQQSRVLTTTTEDGNSDTRVDSPMPRSAEPRAEHRFLINSISCSSRESLLLQQRTVTVTQESSPVTLPFDSYAGVSSTPGRSSISNQQHQLQQSRVLTTTTEDGNSDTRVHYAAVSSTPGRASISNQQHQLQQSRVLTTTTEDGNSDTRVDYAAVSSTPGRSSISNQQHQLQQSRVLTTTTEDGNSDTRVDYAAVSSTPGRSSISNQQHQLQQSRVLTTTTEDGNSDTRVDYAVVSSTPGRSSISNQQHQLQQSRVLTTTTEDGNSDTRVDYAAVSSTPGRSSISNQQHQLQQSRVLTTTTEDGNSDSGDSTHDSTALPDCDYGGQQC
ncbi:hypothetical protein J6590_068264 [Homalodisca vitripennis]|nr:hypothetical protein J6590_068264 [Homalodisca vitripennis]